MKERSVDHISPIGRLGEQEQKRFYNRETYSAAFCMIQQWSIKPIIPSIQLK